MNGGGLVPRKAFSIISGAYSACERSGVNYRRMSEKLGR